MADAYESRTDWLTILLLIFLLGVLVYMIILAIYLYQASQGNMSIITNSTLLYWVTSITSIFLIILIVLAIWRLIYTGGTIYFKEEEGEIVDTKMVDTIYTQPTGSNIPYSNNGAFTNSCYRT